MNNEKFHTSLLQPKQIGSQFKKSTKENVENVVAEDFFGINQHQNDASLNGTDVTEHTRKKHKHVAIMDETVSANMTEKKCC